MKWYVLMAFLWSVSVNAGQVVVRDASEPFDAFAVRAELMRQHEWQEQLRNQQQLQILQVLPLGCLQLTTPYVHFHCGASWYRPYSYLGQQIYIAIPRPSR
ncbi:MULTISPECIES: hypothetical protein [Shewanella]|jgi:hypothetical protein|uniref:hypothetical protein n=1 Tax=Shewanella TaxID=22 RepID=UPI0016754827|nr:hypothetical protein [Shewanella fodinae]MCL2905663.1 hypothetical protein [Shewanella fodinae]GGY97813.1 hypothetical protein GCM10007169_13630 [Shewanella fodinae]